MDSIDYTSAFANVGSSYEAAMLGLKGGAAIHQLETERAAAAAKARQQAQMQAELTALSRNPTPAAIASVMVKYPALSEDLKRGADVAGEAQQKAQLEHGTQVYAAVLNNQPDVARRLLTERATALRNSGNEREASAADAFATMIADHPELAKTTIGVRLAAAMGPDKFTEAFGKIGAEQRAGELQGDLVRKGKADADAAKSDAETKAITAKYADSQALADLAKKQWDIKAIAADIDFKRESNRIAAMNAAFNREGNELKREELKLKIEEARTARDEKLRGKVADVESAAGNIDNMLNTIERIKKNPSLNSVVGSLEGKSLYPNAALGTLNPFGDGDERSDAIALIETLGSQAFLSQIPNIKGMGALSNAEGEKLQAAFQNLSRAQSEKQFRATLEEATRLLSKGRATVSKRYGVPLGAPDTPAAQNGTQPPIDSFFR